jgi:hypothetical protein
MQFNSIGRKFVNCCGRFHISRSHPVLFCRLYARIVIVWLLSGVPHGNIVYATFFRSLICLCPPPPSPPRTELSLVHIMTNVSGSISAVDFFKLEPNPNQEVRVCWNKTVLVCSCLCLQHDVKIVCSQRRSVKQDAVVLRAVARL